MSGTIPLHPNLHSWRAQGHQMDLREATSVGIGVNWLQIGTSAECLWRWQKKGYIAISRPTAILPTMTELHAVGATWSGHPTRSRNKPVTAPPLPEGAFDPSLIIIIHPMSYGDHSQYEISSESVHSKQAVGKRGQLHHAPADQAYNCGLMIAEKRS